ncbi:MAG: carboxymuconolactone decarboxylase family protein [Chloroflexota bacterium]|nr:MAG: carboxymuconolactone decarboxylase family protein [Chloroflexota bacterium]
MTTGYLPSIYKRFTREHPDISRLWEQLTNACYHAGPLDEKTQQLIKLGIAIGLSSEGGVRSHVRQALLSGISREEIEHALLLGLSTAGFPAMIASYQWAKEVLDEGDASGAPGW